MNSDAIGAYFEREAIFDVIRTTATCLDNEALDDWLALFAEESIYEISAVSPEIGAGMSWWKSAREELGQILAEVSGHVRDPGRRLHLVTPVSVEVSGNSASSLSHFAIFRTDPEGRSSVYVVGRYRDTFVREHGRWLYARHCAELETRMLEPFTHLPL